MWSKIYPMFYIIVKWKYKVFNYSLRSIYLIVWGRNSFFHYQIFKFLRLQQCQKAINTASWLIYTIFNKSNQHTDAFLSKIFLNSTLEWTRGYLNTRTIPYSSVYSQDLYHMSGI